MNIFQKAIARVAGIRLSTKSAPEYGGAAITSYPDPHEIQFQNAFEMNEWVNSGSTRKANAVKLGKIHLFRLGKDGNPEEVMVHRALDIIRQPNPYMTLSQLLEKTSIWLDTAGEAFYRIDPVDKQIWELEPDRINIHKGGEYILWYEYRNHDGKSVRYIPEEIMHFKKFNPTDRYRGLSPMKVAARTIDSDIWASTWNRDFFKNGGIPGGYLKSPNSITEEVRKSIQRRWKRMFGGSKNGTVAVMGGGLEYQETGKVPKDMDWKNLQDSNMKKILMVLEVPPEVLGIMDNANRASSDSSGKTFAKNTVDPRLKYFAEQFTMDILNVYFKGQGLYYEFESTAPADTAMEIKKRESDWKIGARTTNEIREDDGRDPVEGGDKIPGGKPATDPNADANGDPNIPPDENAQ